MNDTRHWTHLSAQLLTIAPNAMGKRYFLAAMLAAWAVSAQGLARRRMARHPMTTGRNRQTTWPHPTWPDWRNPILRRYAPPVKPRIAALLGVVAILLAACSTQASGPGWQTAGPLPSTSAKMVCAPEAKDKLDQVLGSTSTSVSKPTWVDHRYSCAYTYPQGTMVLSVKELSSTSETTAFFEGLAKQYGRKQALYGLGQGAFLTNGGSVVVRKDYKILFVDSTGFPRTFVQPQTSSGTPAEAVASTILACWSGQ